MAKYNEILTGRYNKFITKLFGMKGPAPAPQLSSDIAMQMAFFNGVENRFLESWNRYCITAVSNGGGTNFPQIRFRNPTTSKVIAVIERVRFVNNAAADKPFITFAAGLSDLTALALPRTVVDLRQGPNVQSTLVISFANNQAASGATFWQGNMPIGVDVEALLKSDDELIVAPNDAMNLFGNVVANAITVIVLWRERSLEDSELT